MPHGGGHVSHGGGGGGHFGGGGHHHHHHHHQFHGGHRHYGGVVYTGGGYYYNSSRRRRGCIWGSVGLIIVIVVVITISTSVSLSKEEDEEKRFTPGDTRIKTFDTFFCSGIKGSTTYDFDSGDAHLYVVDKEPPLNVRSNVSLSNSFELFEDDYQYWHYYLYENSNITFDGCIRTGNGYWFYIVKGTDKWNDWKDYASSSKAVHDAFITASCEETTTSHFTYRVKGRDHYYLVWYNDQPSGTKGHHTLNIDRFEYAVPTPNGLPNCSFAGSSTSSSCQVSVPMMSSHSKVLLRLPLVEEDYKKEEDFHLDLDCTPRAAAYVIVVLSPIGFVVLVGVIVVGVCYWYVKRSRNRRYQPIVASHSPLASSDLPASSPEQPTAPYYGTKDAPPPYKA